MLSLEPLEPEAVRAVQLVVVAIPSALAQPPGDGKGARPGDKNEKVNLKKKHFKIYRFIFSLTHNYKYSEKH